MTTTPRLTAAAVTRVVRKATGSDLFTSRTEPSIGVVRVSQRYAVAGALASADTRDRREARARLAAAALVQAGYEVARTGDRLTVTLPEPTSDADAFVDEVATRHGIEVPPVAEAREQVRISTREELIERQVASGVTPERAAMIADARDALQAEFTRNAPAIAAALDDEVEQLLDEVEARADAEHAEGLVHLMSDALLDACGTAAPGGLHLAPSTTPERITCPACLVLAVEEAAADAVVEQDVPPTADERVTVRISARELRAGDEVVDSLGNRQYAAFDTDAGTHIVDGRLVRVWTAIRDQEAGLPPVITVPAERELLVLRPVSAEGRELLAALDRI